MSERILEVEGLSVDIPLPSVAPDMRILSYKVAPNIQLKFSKDGADNFTFSGTVLPARCEPMEIAWTPEHMYVPSAPSTLATIASAWIPMAAIAGSAARAAMQSSIRTPAWLPSEMTWVKSRPLVFIVRLRAMLPDWVTSAAPRLPSRRRHPWTSGHSAAPLVVLMVP